MSRNSEADRPVVEADSFIPFTLAETITITNANYKALFGDDAGAIIPVDGGWSLGGVSLLAMGQA